MSATIISFMNRKGGVGKSTLLLLTASSLHHRTGKKVLVIDADLQTSILGLREEEKEMEQGESSFYEIVGFSWSKKNASDIPLLRFHKLIQQIENKYDYVLVDTPGKMEGEEVPLIMTVSDFIVVPIIASSFDIQSTIDFLEIIPPIREDKIKEGFELKVFGVVNKKDRSLEHKHLEALQGIAGMELFDTHISNLVRYKRDKSTFYDLVDPKEKEDEFNLYFNELLGKIK
ncbi:MAG: hypothetical protein CMO01_20020 [Thalassobius sp.]|nr:hypothetical protein [Thalassovita sp.]